MEAELAEVAAAPGAGRATRGLRAWVLALGAVGLSCFALTIAARAGFAWPLEWMEGASVQHARRLLQGQPLYAAPSAAFVPYLYPPLAYVPMAAALWAFGPTLVAARAASLGCALGSLLLVARIAGAAGARSAWAAAGLFAIGFGYAGAFLDLARVDACFVLLVLLGVERLHAGRPWAALAWLALSAFAKQHGALLLLGASAALLAADARRHARAVIAVWSAAIAAFVALQLASGGWFARYVVSLPASQPLAPALLWSFVPIDLCVYLPVLVGAAAYDAGRRFAARALVPADAVLAMAIVAGALGRAHAGGHDNVRLPAFALLCCAGATPLLRAIEDPARRARTRVLACAALSVQFAMLWQAPSLYAPPASSAPRFTALRAALERCADHGSSAALDYAGLGTRALVHTMALSDLRMSGDRALAQQATAALLAALRAPDAPRALAVGERFAALDRVLAARYRECARVPAPELATGYRPGRLIDGERVQVVYALAASDGRAVPP
jgi:hypothetical protein